MLVKSEVFIAHKVGNVVRATGDEIVHPDNLMPVSNQTVGEMRAEKSGCASNKNTHKIILFLIIPSR